MRAQQYIESDRHQEVASLLVPIVDKLLLLPNVTVAEIVPVAQVSPVADGPDWLLGEFVWREIKLPLISYELLNGNSKPSLNARCRIAVLNTTGESDDLGFIAVLTQGLPRLARITPDEIVENSDAPSDTYDDMAISWSGELATIPSVARIEQAYLAARKDFH
ncbi:chemotaxis protein CheW [Gilvimarinus sp. SDUM040013]|uniref:Chemotaxis protein CheW n=1 Tax=Gilvimarinus gilvus TaxID=3058038 RepID=A0ABU4RZ48_9GAMM|nr:chemotaxis protein CheW [Gilvimarinus sp. SDUM040013]MDO3387582.1 chemotaxis protein CheW [Gilvimarinus sp. SDUM040013]MDX6850153.1 chemotaxis protein CheW [Gilvimarinus sp. SDUM040013]